jgi:hypothetical protein
MNGMILRGDCLGWSRNECHICSFWCPSAFGFSVIPSLAAIDILMQMARKLSRSWHQEGPLRPGAYGYLSMSRTCSQLR